MQKQDTFSTIERDSAEVPTLEDMFIPVWRSRWLVLLITVLVAALAVAANIFTATYKSQGFFQFGGPVPLAIEKSIWEQAKEREADREKNKDKKREKDDDKGKELAPGISLANFKRYAAAYVTGEQFTVFVRERKLEEAPGVAELQSAFASRDGIGKAIEPVYLFTKLDAKELMDQPKDGGNNVLGLQISYSSKSPQLSQKMVELLGRYAMDSIIYSIYSDELRAQLDETKNKIAKLDNEIITARVQFEQHREKAASLKQIIARNPAAMKDASRQVVEVSESTAQYLPLTTQLNTEEVLASDALQLIDRAKRERGQKVILLEYYDRAKAVLDRNKSGERVLRSLEDVKAEVFKGKNLQDDAIKEVFNTITAHNQSALNLYLDRTRFVAGPTLPQHSSARPSIALAIGLLAGFVIALLVVFTRGRLRRDVSADA